MPLPGRSYLCSPNACWMLPRGAAANTRKLWQLTHWTGYSAGRLEKGNRCGTLAANLRARAASHLLAVRGRSWPSAWPGRAMTEKLAQLCFQRASAPPPPRQFKLCKPCTPCDHHLQALPPMRFRLRLKSRSMWLPKPYGRFRPTRLQGHLGCGCSTCGKPRLLVSQTPSLSTWPR